MKDRGSFEWTPKPKVDGKLCPYVVLEGPIAKRVVGLSLIREDLYSVREVFSRMQGNTDDIIGNKALLFGALSLYGKCFTQAKGRGVNLDPKKVFQDSTGKESHYRLMEMRHEFVAHGGNAREEKLKLLLLLDPDKNTKSMRDIVGRGLSAHGFDSQAQKECLETVDEVLSYVEQSLDEASAYLSKNLSDKGVDWAYDHAIWPDT
jgi:hypothetical protein